MGLNDDNIPSLIDLINSNSVLRNLSVGVSNAEQINNVCSKTACFSIFKALESNTNLISVNFSNNFFPAHNETANAIAKMLKTNKKLKSLWLLNLFTTKDNKAVPIILSALAENQTLTTLNLNSNSTYLTFPLIYQLRKNTSLTELYLSIDPNNYGENFWATRPCYENKTPKKVLLALEQILERNINRKISSLYQNLLLVNSLGLPNELNHHIFPFMLLTFQLGEFSKISEKSLSKNRDYFNPPVVEVTWSNRFGQPS